MQWIALVTAGYRLSGDLARSDRDYIRNAVLSMIGRHLASPALAAREPRLSLDIPKHHPGSSGSLNGITAAAGTLDGSIVTSNRNLACTRLPSLVVRVRRGYRDVMHTWFCIAIYT